MLPETIKRLPGVQSALLRASWVQRRYFDWRHNVRTMGDVEVSDMDPVSDDTALAGFYHPTHPRAARRILSMLPVSDHSKYTFIDLGSGKGLMLLLAAEYPYAAIRGVEFSRKLHDVAAHNIATYRNPRQRCFEVQSVNIDARDYEFPATPLVVYLFNSFRHELLARVLHNLDASLGTSPRDALVVYLNPLDAYLFDRLQHIQQIPLQLVEGSRAYRSVYDSAGGSASG
jgi:SAM-dependent methyltransferase